jgi:hypothetical protein
MENSNITLNARNEISCYTGPDAVQLFRAKILISSLRLWAKTKIIPTRGMGIGKMLAFATHYTGKKYTPKRALEAADDVQKWADAMLASLPVA